MLKLLVKFAYVQMAIRARNIRESACIVVRRFTLHMRTCAGSERELYSVPQYYLYRFAELCTKLRVPEL